MYFLCQFQTTFGLFLIFSLKFWFTKELFCAKFKIFFWPELENELGPKFTHNTAFQISVIFTETSPANVLGNQPHRDICRSDLWSTKARLVICVLHFNIFSTARIPVNKLPNSISKPQSTIIFNSYRKILLSAKPSRYAVMMSWKQLSSLPIIREKKTNHSADPSSEHYNSSNKEMQLLFPMKWEINASYSPAVAPFCSV